MNRAEIAPHVNQDVAVHMVTGPRLFGWLVHSDLTQEYEIRGFTGTQLQSVPLHCPFREWEAKRIEPLRGELQEQLASVCRCIADDGYSWANCRVHSLVW